MFEREIEQAELEREELDSRIQRLNEEMVALEDAIRRAEGELYRLTGYIEALEKISAESDDSAENEEGPSKRVANPSRAVVADAALSLIQKAGHPLKRAELYSELRREGLVIAGKDPAMILSTMLWRERDRITRIRGFGYWPADRPYTPAGYVPTGQGSLL